MKNSKSQILVGAALAAALVGVVSSVATLQATPQAIAKMNRRATDYATLQGLAGDLERAKAALRAREGMGRDRAVPVQDLVMSAFPGAMPQVQPREARPLIEGWAVRSVEVVLDDVALEGVGKLAAEAARARPPWHVAECAITASDRAGYGRVTLLLESIERGGRDG